jgi:hypothetical protein
LTSIRGWAGILRTCEVDETTTNADAIKRAPREPEAVKLPGV